RAGGARAPRPARPAPRAVAPPGARPPRSSPPFRPPSWRRGRSRARSGSSAPNVREEGRSRESGGAASGAPRRDTSWEGWSDRRPSRRLRWGGGDEAQLEGGHRGLGETDRAQEPRKVAVALADEGAERARPAALQVRGHRLEEAPSDGAPLVIGIDA